MLFPTFIENKILGIHFFFIKTFFFHLMFSLCFFSSAVPSGSGAFKMPTRPSSAAAAASTLKGGRANLRNAFSNFFSFLA